MNNRFKFRLVEISTGKIINTDANSDEHFLLYVDGRLFKKYYGSASNDIRIIEVTNLYKIEQSTGMEDKNVKLCYEGDIILDGVGEIYEVFWDLWLGGFYIKNVGLKDCVQPFPRLAEFSNHCEIIGNIHENKEGLK